jgi:hypothetical protein
LFQRQHFEPANGALGEHRYANSVAALLIRFVIVVVEREPFIPAPSTGALWLVVSFILLSGHATYSADRKNRVERVSAPNEQIRPRCFHVLNNHCCCYAAVASTVQLRLLQAERLCWLTTLYG